MSRGKKSNPLQNAAPRRAADFEAIDQRLAKLYKFQGTVEFESKKDHGMGYAINWTLPDEAFVMLKKCYPQELEQNASWLVNALQNHQEGRGLFLHYGASRSTDFNTLGYLERLASKYSLAAMCCDKVYLSANKFLTEEFPGGIWPHPQNEGKSPSKKDWIWMVSPKDLNYLLDNFDEFVKPLPKIPKDILTRYKVVRDRIEKTTPKEYQADVFTGYCKLQSPRGTHLSNSRGCSLTSLREILETRETSANPDFWDRVGEMMDPSIIAAKDCLPRVSERVSWKEQILSHNPGDR